MDRPYFIDSSGYHRGSDYGEKNKSIFNFLRVPWKQANHNHPTILFQNLRVVYQRLHLPKTTKNDFLEAASKNVKKWIFSFCCLTFSFPSLKRELEGKGFTKELSHYQEKKKYSTCKISLRKRYLEKCNEIPLECNKIC